MKWDIYCGFIASSYSVLENYRSYGLMISTANEYIDLRISLKYLLTVSPEYWNLSWTKYNYYLEPWMVSFNIECDSWMKFLHGLWIHCVNMFKMNAMTFQNRMSVCKYVNEVNMFKMDAMTNKYNYCNT